MAEYLKENGSIRKMPSPPKPDEELLGDLMLLSGCSASNQFEAGEAQQKLLAAGCLEGYCGSGVDAASLHLFHYSQTEAVVCNLLARLDGRLPGG